MQTYQQEHYVRKTICAHWSQRENIKNIENIWYIYIYIYIYIKNIMIFLIFSIFWYFRKYHDIFQPWNERKKRKILRRFRKTASESQSWCDVAWQTVIEMTSCDRKGTVADGVSRVRRITNSEDNDDRRQWRLESATRHSKRVGLPIR